MTRDAERGRMDKAVSSYSLLFKLPSYRKILILLGFQCTIMGILAMLSFNLSFSGLLGGSILGGILFLASWSGNQVAFGLLMNEDPVMNLRRGAFLAFASNLILSVFAVSANAALAVFKEPLLWTRIISFGVFASLSLRFLVFYAVSFASPLRTIASVLLQPSLFLIVIAFVPYSFFGFQAYYLLHPGIAAGTAFLGVSFFANSLNNIGVRDINISSLKLFRAFIADWTEDLEKPFEDVLEDISEERNLRVSLIAFKTEKGSKALIVVPNLHPGPFKNIGSSSLPSLIQSSLEKKLECVISVPHGISGHELDLASHVQNEIVLERILESSEFEDFNPYATQFVGVEKDGVNVGCQLFGGCALLTLTLAPETMEDLPLELNEIIVEAAERKGISCIVPIDAHNSIDGPFYPDKVVALIGATVVSALEKAANLAFSHFEVGAAKVVPTEYGPKEGMGPGGICVIVTKVGCQRTAYVILDGNNMVSHLREKILSHLKTLGIDNGEVLTTDTHLVNAIVLTGRGYYPIGEAMEHDKLIKYVELATDEALKNMEPAEASWRQEEIRGARVIGERQIRSMTSLVDKGIKAAKRNSAVIFPVLGILLIALLVSI